MILGLMKIYIGTYTNDLSKYIGNSYGVFFKFQI